jgi:broad specificity phosphatase PhoE
MALQKGKHFLALIRHGERADKVSGRAQKFTNMFDPPLTEIGK